jgi:glycosyltransferase involved in cell wall biosynthesis
VYNEGKILEEVFQRVLQVTFPPEIEVEWVVIDDHSRDNSWEIIQQFSTRTGAKIFRQPVNCGKGAALREGFKSASGDIIAVHDADFEYDLHDMVSLVEPFLKDKADVVYGSRFRRTSPQVHRTFHYLGNRFLTFLSNLASGLYLTDMETCYKVFRKEIIKALPLQSNRFGFEPEVTAWIAKLNLRIHEYPISYYPRNYLQGKKIGWRDGFAALWFILKFNFAKLDSETLSKLPARYLK